MPNRGVVNRVMNAASVPESVLFLRHPDGEWLVGWGAMERLSQPPADRMAFYLPDFFTIDPAPWWVPEFAERMDRGSLESRFPGLLGANSVVQPRTWRGPDERLFTEEFSSLIGAIEKGELTKAVPFAMMSCEGTPDLQERARLWSRTLPVATRWMAYGGWWHGEGLIGLSPEILFYSQPGWTETMALAGTAAENTASLLESEKDQREHQIVVEDIRRQLETFGPVKATPTREWKLGRLNHLRTDLAIEKEVPFMDLVRALHPTPALGVAPREKGLDVLRELPSAGQRRRFGAPFGVNLPGELALCCVAIRGLQWHDGYTWLASGCGLVAGSQLEREWQELALKRRVVQEQFGL